MFLRALIAFLALPGVVAIAIPLGYLWSTERLRPTHPLGLVMLFVGFTALLWCVRDFYVSGKGTLAPWAPPERLVVVGLYRYTRNPMYVAVTLMLMGWAATSGANALWFYAACVAFAFHLRVVLAEEPWLARRHGETWFAYAKRTPRWLIR